MSEETSKTREISEAVFKFRSEKKDHDEPDQGVRITKISLARQDDGNWLLRHGADGAGDDDVDEFIFRWKGAAVAAFNRYCLIERRKRDLVSHRKMLSDEVLDELDETEGEAGVRLATPIHLVAELAAADGLAKVSGTLSSIRIKNGDGAILRINVSDKGFSLFETDDPSEAPFHEAPFEDYRLIASGTLSFVGGDDDMTKNWETEWKRMSGWNDAARTLKNWAWTNGVAEIPIADKEQLVRLYLEAKDAAGAAYDAMLAPQMRQRGFSIVLPPTSDSTMRGSHEKALSEARFWVRKHHDYPIYDRHRSLRDACAILINVDYAKCKEAIAKVSREQSRSFFRGFVADVRSAYGEVDRAKEAIDKKRRIETRNAPAQTTARPARPATQRPQERPSERRPPAETSKGSGREGGWKTDGAKIEAEAEAKPVMFVNIGLGDAEKRGDEIVGTFSHKGAEMRFSVKEGPAKTLSDLLDAEAARLAGGGAPERLHPDAVRVRIEGARIDGVYRIKALEKAAPFAAKGRTAEK